jgi:MFS family permease
MTVASVSLNRNREFMLLWSGQALSGLGSQISTVAYPLLVLAVTGSAAKAGVVGLARWIPAPLFALPAGILADRLNRKRLMVLCDGVRAVARAGMAIVIATSTPPFLVIVAVALIDGAGSIVTSTAERGAVRQLVAADQLSEAAARNESRTFGAWLVGPPVGGLLFGIARVFPFVADAISFAASTASKLLIKTDFQETRADSSIGDIWEGIRWTWRRPFFRTCSVLWAASSPVLLGLQLLVVLIAKSHHASSALIGVMLGIAAVGGLLGALLAPRLQRLCSPRFVLAGEIWVTALLLPLLLLAHNALVLGVIYAAATMVVPVSNTVVVGYRTALAPDHLQGRVAAAFVLVSLSVGWLGPLIVGLLFQSAGQTATVLILAGWTMVLAAAATASPALRRAPTLETAPTPSAAVP